MGRSKKKSRVKKIVVEPKHSDAYMKSKEGEYFEADTYDQIIDYDCDVYRKDKDGNEHLLLTFRKNVIPYKLTRDGLNNLKKAAMKTHDNRGASAGVIDLSKLPAYANEMKSLPMNCIC